MAFSSILPAFAHVDIERFERAFFNTAGVRWSRAVPSHKASIAAVHTSSHHHTLRDLPQAYVVLVYAAMALALVAFATYSPRLMQSDSPPPAPAASGVNQTRHFVGSIMIDAPKGDLCWQRMFDNATGAMWDNGYVKCEWAQAALAHPPDSGVDVRRLLEVGKAFRHTN